MRDSAAYAACMVYVIGNFFAQPVVDGVQYCMHIIPRAAATVHVRMAISRCTQRHGELMGQGVQSGRGICDVVPVLY